MLSFFNPAAAVSSKYQHSLYTTPYPGNVRWQGYNLHFTNIRLHCSYEVLIACGGKAAKLCPINVKHYYINLQQGVQKIASKVEDLGTQTKKYFRTKT